MAFLQDAGMNEKVSFKRAAKTVLFQYSTDFIVQNPVILNSVLRIAPIFASPIDNQYITIQNIKL
jgi:hypothetical protein